MRLIDADTLKHEIAKVMPSRTEVFLVIDGMPDVIVRCKDCKKHDTYDCHITYLTTQKTPNDWFCADGERKAVK